MTHPTPDLSIIVVTHEHRAYVERCFSAIEAARSEGLLETFLVDNCSSDGTHEFVRTRFPWVTALTRDRRRGFSDNNNFALRQSSGRYVLVLNPDTELRPGALRSLIRFMDTTPEAGIAGAKLLFPDGSIQPSCRRFPSLGSVIARRSPLRFFLKQSSANTRHLMLDESSPRPREVDWLLGACLFVRRKAFEEVGLLDEGYFLYVEDIDWCYRMHEGGWKVFHVPEAEIIHHHLAVSDRHFFSWHSWVHLKGMWRYWRKHLAPGWLRLRPPLPR